MPTNMNEKKEAPKNTIKTGTVKTETASPTVKRTKPEAPKNTSSGAIKTPELDNWHPTNYSDELAAFMGYSPYTGDPEDVARHRWEEVGITAKDPNRAAAQFREATSNDLNVLGRSVVGGAQASVRNTANFYSNATQMGAAVNSEVDRAMNKYDSGDKETIAEANKAYADYLSKFSDNDRQAMEMNGQLLDKKSVFYSYIQNKAAEDHANDELKKASSWGESYQNETRNMKVSDKSYIQLGEGIGGMAPQVALGLATQGVSALGVGANAMKAISTANGILSNAAMYGSSAGGAYEEAKAGGASTKDAMEYASGVGAMEVASEHLANGLGKVGKLAGLKGISDKAVSDFISKNITDAGGRKVAEFAIGLFGEGVEEAITEWADYGIDKLTINQDDRTLAELSQDALSSFAMGATISAFFQGTSVAIENAEARLRNKGMPITAETIRNEVSKEEVAANVKSAMDEMVAEESNRTKTAGKILNDPQLLSEFEERFGPVQGKSKTEKLSYIASALYTENYNTVNADAIEQKRQTERDNWYEQPQNEPSEQTPTSGEGWYDQQFAPKPKLSGTQSYVRGLIGEIQNGSKSAVGEILQNPEYRAAFQQLIPEAKLEGSNNAIRAEIERLAKSADMTAVTRTALDAYVPPRQSTVPSDVMADIISPQTPVDIPATPQYNETNGGVANGDIAGNLGETVGGSNAQRTQGSNLYGGTGLDRGTAQRLDQSSVSPELRSQMNNNGIVDTGLQSQRDGAFFADSISAAKQIDAKNGVFVSPKTEEEIREIIQAGGKVLLNENGSVGVVVTADGDIEAVFKNQQTGPKGALGDIMLTAIANGGKKLDCYGIGLVNKYAQYGFVPVAQVDFNPEYADPAWNFDYHGSPQIYFMLHNGDPVSAIVRSDYNYHNYSQDDLDALPRYNKDTGYDEAAAYRDSLLEQRQPEGPYHPFNQSAAEATQEIQGRGETLVPTTDTNGYLTSKSASTLANSPVTTNELALKLQQDAVDGKFSRIAYSDSAAVAKAEQRISEIGWDAAVAEYEQNVKDGKVSKDITTMGIVLYNNAVNGGNVAQALDIVNLMIKNVGSAASGLQAQNIINKLSPEGRLYATLRSIENIKESTAAKFPDSNIEVDEALLNNYYEALKNGSEVAQKEAMTELMQDVGQQLPNSFRDVFNAIRYLAMLGNVRTQVRNVLGNLGFAGVRGIKNTVKYGIESATLRNGQERSIAFLNRANAKDKALITMARNDFAISESAIMSGGKYNEDGLNDAVRSGREVFINKNLAQKAAEGNKIAKIGNAALRGLQAYQNLTEFAMDKGDILFSKPAYATALARYIKANGLTEVFLNGTISQDQLSRAREIAVKEAAKATYRDINALSKTITDIKSAVKKTKVGSVLWEGLLPFTKTPANILARAFEYSPAGIIQGFAQLNKAVNTGTISVSEAIDTISSGLTGTALMALGAFLAAHGLLTGGGKDDEEQDAFDELTGREDYAFHIGGKYETADWLAPEAIPMFIGANIYERSIDGGLTFQETLDAIKGIAEPITEMSMLSGVNEFLTTGKYKDNASLADYAISLGTNYISQFLPTLAGQIERTAENGRQETYRYNDDLSGFISSGGQRTLGQVMNKLPGEFQQIDYVDAWGRKSEYGNMNWANQFLNPGYTSSDNVTDADKELQRLYNAGEKGVFPERAAQSMTIDGNHLTAEQYERYNITKGQTSYQLVSSLIKSSEYKQMDNSTKAETIRKMYSYANAVAMSEVEPGKERTGWIGAALESDDPGAFIRTYSALKSDTNDYRAIDAAVSSYGKMSESDKKAIDSSVPNAKKLYEASQAGIGSKDFYKTADAVADIKVLPDHSSATNWQKYEAILSTASDKNMDGMFSVYMDENSYKRYSTARAAGVSAKQYVDAYTAIQLSDSQKKWDIISTFRGLGYSQTQATYLYDVFKTGMDDLQNLNSKYGY